MIADEEANTTSVDSEVSTVPAVTGKAGWRRQRRAAGFAQGDKKGMMRVGDNGQFRQVVVVQGMTVPGDKRC